MNTPEEEKLKEEEEINDEEFEEEEFEDEEDEDEEDDEEEYDEEEDDEDEEDEEEEEEEEEEEKAEAPTEKAEAPTEKAPAHLVTSEEEKTISSPEEIPLPVVIEVGRLKMTVQTLMDLKPGNLLELDVHPESGVDLVINGSKVGHGELLQVGETLGVRVLEIGK